MAGPLTAALDGVVGHSLAAEKSAAPRSRRRRARRTIVAYRIPPGAAKRSGRRHIVAVAREAAGAGVDEVNFDFIRFPTDGNLSGIRYPVFDPRTQTRPQALTRFLSHLPSR